MTGRMLKRAITSDKRRIVTTFLVKKGVNGKTGSVVKKVIATVFKMRIHALKQIAVGLAIDATSSSIMNSNTTNTKELWLDSVRRIVGTTEANGGTINVRPSMPTRSSVVM